MGFALAMALLAPVVTVHLPHALRICNNGSAGSVENSYNVTLQIFHTIIIPDFLSFVKYAAPPSIIVSLPDQIFNMPLIKKEKRPHFLRSSIFCCNLDFLVKFGYTKWCYASHSDVAHLVRSEAMCSGSRAEGTLHFRRKHPSRSAHHVSLAEHIVEKRKRPHNRGLYFFLAPRTGLEPVTSPIVSDSRACANIARATRQSHSRLGRSLAHFRYSLLLPLTRKNSRSGSFFLVNYQLRPRPSAFSVGIQMGS